MISDNRLFFYLSRSSSCALFLYPFIFNFSLIRFDALPIWPQRGRCAMSKKDIGAAPEPKGRRTAKEANQRSTIAIKTASEFFSHVWFVIETSFPDTLVCFVSPLRGPAEERKERADEEKCWMSSPRCAARERGRDFFPTGIHSPICGKHWLRSSTKRFARFACRLNARKLI